MIIYIIIIILSALLVSFDFVKLRKDQKVYFYIPFFLVLILFSGLRPASIDRDYDAYHTVFGYMEYFGWDEMLSAYSTYQMELGYIFINKLFFSLGFSFDCFLFFYELITGTLLALLIYRYSSYPFLSLCMYVSMFFFLREFTQIRFALGSILMITGIMRLGEGKKTGWIYLILSGLFHSSCLIGLFIPICHKIINNRWIYLIIPPLGAIIGLFNPINIILRFVGLPEQLARYLDSTTDVGVAFLSFIFIYLLLVISIGYYESLKSMFGLKFEYIYISSSISIFIGLMFLTFPIMQRISGALFTISILYVPYILELFKKRKNYAFTAIFAFSVLSIFIFYGIKLIAFSKILQPYFK